MDGLWVRRPMIVSLKEFPQVSSNTVGFCSVATGTPITARPQKAHQVRLDIS
jgi:hypothetical protein